MKKTKTKKIVFLTSGDGGNLHFLSEVIKNNLLKDAEIVEVISDRECNAILIAKKNQLPSSNVDFSENDQVQLLQKLSKINPDLIVTTVHRILHKSIVTMFHGKLINLHYSLLPSFGGSIGMSPVHDSIKFGSKFLGVTVHYAEEQVDMGKPIAQIIFPIFDESLTIETQNLVFRSGCLCLLAAIYSKFNPCFGGNESCILKVQNKNCLLSGAILPAESKNLDENFWLDIQNAVQKIAK
tara:strand:+ start:1046 stop:1762 length:717 start_codon:yes stop_codon:yes gene_type:complete